MLTGICPQLQLPSSSEGPSLPTPCILVPGHPPPPPSPMRSSSIPLLPAPERTCVSWLGCTTRGICVGSMRPDVMACLEGGAPPAPGIPGGGGPCMPPPGGPKAPGGPGGRIMPGPPGGMPMPWGPDGGAPKPGPAASACMPGGGAPKPPGAPGIGGPPLAGPGGPVGQHSGV